ncbi:hypothetical protein K438DRAFT_1779494 [Mycena galopus ATCC 62051]|nr:hypothetical protein K438DRAFT_1779494 [Mycena galopus ATCC 62051]
MESVDGVFLRLCDLLVHPDSVFRNPQILRGQLQALAATSVGVPVGNAVGKIIRTTGSAVGNHKVRFHPIHRGVQYPHTLGFHASSERWHNIEVPGWTEHAGQSRAAEDNTRAEKQRLGSGSIEIMWIETKHHIKWAKFVANMLRILLPRSSPVAQIGRYWSSSSNAERCILPTIQVGEVNDRMIPLPIASELYFLKIQDGSQVQLWPFHVHLKKLEFPGVTPHKEPYSQEIDEDDGSEECPLKYDETRSGKFSARRKFVNRPESSSGTHEELRRGCISEDISQESNAGNIQKSRFCKVLEAQGCEPSEIETRRKLDAMLNGVAVLSLFTRHTKNQVDAEAGMKGKRKIDKWPCSIVATNYSKDCEFKANRRCAGDGKKKSYRPEECRKADGAEANDRRLRRDRWQAATSRRRGQEQRVKLEAENQAQKGDIGCVGAKRGGGKMMETTDRIGGYHQEVTGDVTWREGRESEERSERGQKAVNDRSETQRNAQTWREESELEVDVGTRDWSCRRIELAKSLRAGGTGEPEG